MKKRCERFLGAVLDSLFRSLPYVVTWLVSRCFRH